MLQFTGEKFSCCDGVSRRNFLKVGSLSLGALTLPQILAQRAKAAEAGKPVKKTAMIFIELAGGPTQFETYDPKPNAPVEYRGPLQAIDTCLPGVQFSEFMVEQAKIADKLAVIRSMHHDSSSHGTSSHLTQTGYYLQNRQSRENSMPSIGSITAKVRGPNAEGMLPFVSVPRSMRFGGAAYLGKSYNAFETGGDPNRSNFRVNNLSLNKVLNIGRLDDRRALLASLDDSRALLDTRGVADAVGKFTQQAFDLVTGDRARKAFDIGAEDAKVRDRYGRNSIGQSILLARRLVEAGVTFVTVRVGSWDDHGKIAQRMKQKGPGYDAGVAALISDLHERGMDKDVLVVAMGEFGRTPRVNGSAGRDHWGRVMSVLMAGGGLQVGQIVGSSNSKGEVPKDAPYRPENVLAVAYRHLGVDTATTFLDFAGRPRYVLENQELITELI